MNMLQVIYEFQKVLQKKNLIFFLIIICILHIGAFIYNQQLNPIFPPSAYAKLQSHLDKSHRNYRTT